MRRVPHVQANRTPPGRNEATPCPSAAIVRVIGLALLMQVPQNAHAADLAGRDLTVVVPRAPRPAVRSPVLPGAPIPYSGSPLLTPLDLSVVDGQTRFLAPGPAQERCPHDRIVFVPGVVNPFRPTIPGDGAFMCKSDAVAEGFVAP